MFSQRDRIDGCGRQPGYVAFNEAEDVLLDATGADLAFVTQNPLAPLARGRRLAGRAYRRVTSSHQPLPRLPFPGLNRSATVTTANGTGARTGDALEQHYDLGVFVGYSMWDLPLIEALYDLRRRCDTLVAWFPEAWPSEFADRRLALEPYDLADHHFVGVAPSADALARQLGHAVHYLPLAVDAARFAPLDHHAPRPIDVLGIGRRLPQLHDALLDWSRKSSRLYVYDTVSGLRINDLRAHRENLADTYRRTNLALTHYAKFDDPVTAGQREVPGRLWEALASGALMAGMPPDEQLQERLLGQQLVAALPADPSAAVDLIDELVRADATDQRRHQVSLALNGNDWSHRWQQVFHTAGLAVPAGLAGRLDHLGALAATLSL